jgi:hypothetical protein
VLVVEEIENTFGSIDDSKNAFTEEFDDALFGMAIAIKNKSEASNQCGWEKEDEKVKKKLERLSINSIKYKYA